MKTLHLIRHAKSSWEDSSLTDEARPLKKRGLKDCSLMAQILGDQKAVLDRVFCSPAQRAQMTIETLLTQLKLKSNWVTDQGLYTFNAQSLLEWWQQRNDAFNHITQVGHNPGMTDLIEHLTGKSIGNLPTCGYAQLKFNGHHWANLSADSCQLVAFITPKHLKSS